MKTFIWVLLWTVFGLSFLLLGYEAGRVTGTLGQGITVEFQFSQECSELPPLSFNPIPPLEDYFPMPNSPLRSDDGPEI